MSSLDELIHYCNEPDPVGALMLTGEWGCGKTYIIENDLTEALKDTHIIVRVSLFGMDNAKALRDAVRQRWFEVCIPLLGAIQKAKERGLFAAINSMIAGFNPIAGGTANVVVSANMQEFIPIKPVVEDFKTHEKKNVVLVYDDLERSKIGLTEALGVINDYCENQKFNSIISVNWESLRPIVEKDLDTYHMLKEKAISQVLYHVPDYDEVIHAIISERVWPTPEYGEYLLSHEDLIRDVFIADHEVSDLTSLIKGNRKNHNFRTLTKGMQSFYRIYDHITGNGNEVPENHLYSFLAYYLIANSGFIRDGKHILSFEEKDIKELYPKYLPKSVTAAERSWITTGIWDKERFLKEIAKKSGQSE